MAEDKKSGAKSELGNLFVDIGSSGLGGLIKGLNSLNASFLLTTKAAQAFTKPIINMSKNAGQGLVGLEKINAVTGMTIEQLQELKLWSKASSVDFGSFISQIGSLQQNLLNIQLGKGGNMKGFTLLGLDPRSLDYNKPMEALEKIKKRVQQLDEATGALALQELGLSSDLLFAWKREEIQINKKLLLNKEEQKKLDEQNTLWNSIGATIEAIYTKWISQQTWLNDLLKKTIGYLNEEHPIIQEIIADVKEMAKWVLFAVKGWKSIIEAMIIFKNANTNPIKQEQIDNMTPEQRIKYNKAREKQLKEKIKAKYGNNISDKELEAKVTAEEIKQARKDAKRFHLLPMLYRFVKKRVDANYEDYKSAVKINKPIDNEPLSPIPPSLKNGNNSSSAYDLTAVPQAALSHNSNNFEINITQNITGQDALDIASISSDKIEDSFSSIERQILSSL